MKLNFKYILPLLGAVAMMSSCDENSWNNALDGFEEPPVYDKVETITYTLTAADYNTISTLSANVSLAASLDESEALAAVGTNGYFADEAQARRYIPALLSSSSFPYFSMNNESSIKVSYNVESKLPADVAAINASLELYTLGQDDYIEAWGSDDDYISAFAPSCPASRYLPGILGREYDDATAGTYAVVTYNEAAVDPIFGTVGGGDVAPTEWEATSVVSGASLNDNLVVKGYVTAICARGFIVTDNSGSILCYQASGFDQTAVNIGSKVTVKGTVSAYNKGLQIAVSAGDYSVDGAGEYTYPAPAVQSVSDIVAACGATDNFLPKYVQFTGTLSISGTYYNVILDGEETVQGSVYYASDLLKAGLVDGQKYTFTGYFMAVSGSGKYYNILLTEYSDGAAKATARRAPAGNVVSSEREAIYLYNGSTWSVPANTIVVQPADYAAMGQSYGNLSGDHPKTLVPVYLKQQLPYAVEGDVKTVVYKYYANSMTAYRAGQYQFTGGEWVLNEGLTTDQFTKSEGEWKYNPSVVITLPYARNTDPSYTYYMECVNWVFETICKPMGETSLTSGTSFIDYRGNAEFYSGASAYYGNVDVRASSAKSHIPEGYTVYDGMSDDEIVLLLKKRFCTEVLPGALSRLHADAAPVADMDITYTVNFTAYDGAATEQTVVYTVVGPGEFKYKSCTWFAGGEDADW